LITYSWRKKGLLEAWYLKGAGPQQPYEILMDTLRENLAEDDGHQGQDGGTCPASILYQLSKSLTNLPSSASTVLPPQIPSPTNLGLHTSLPSSSQTLPNVTSHLLTAITPYLNASSLSPRYYGFVTGGATPAALTADVLASIYDQNVHVHLPHETVSTIVEAAALNMLLDLFYLPRAEWGIGIPGGKGGSATLTTGATASNVLGLALGREFVLAAAAAKAGSPGMSVAEHGIAAVMAVSGITKIQVLSTMPHSSLGKAASIAGIGRANVVSIASPVDPLAIDLRRLEGEIRTPHTANILVISAGEVNTGRFATSSGAEMAQLRRICDEAGVWIHVDGAFGLFGRVLARLERGEKDEFKQIIEGTEGLHLADSITGDGHKLLNVPYDCGFFFARHKRLAEEVCGNGGAAYLTPGVVDRAGDGIQSPLNIGIENSRRFRALPVYATLLCYGRSGYVDMLMRQVRLARRLAAFLFDHQGYELLPAEGKKADAVSRTFIVALFRAKDEAVNKELVTNINSTGKIYVSGTQWEGKPAARIAVSNWRVDVERDIEIAQEVLTAVLS
jgi:glutamate/tyrosine decarboxylase-like PLP-dependent enzyme